MQTEVSDAHLRRFVVRIEDPAGDSAWGSGVLVAPGWVLTCAHVVEGLDAVRIVPDRLAAVQAASSPGDLAGWVRARSGERPEWSQSAFWPFPDLALIELDGWTDHVFAPLVMAEPRRGGEAHAWGFGAREPGVAAVGSPASFVYVGLEGDGFLSLKAGDAPPGLSGAPLVCPVRRAVVGLMSVSRNPSDARGGWASPVAGLAAITGPADGEGVPTELARIGADVLAMNREQAWQHRDAWNRVLPVPDADRLVDRPWDGVDPRRPAVPSTMLRAEFGVVAYLARGTELTTALSWCAGRTSMAVSYIDAPGGAGKTRFAIELCREMSSRGWLAGLLPRQDRQLSEVTLPRLVVVDYVEERDASALTEQIAALTQSATDMTPVRVLLLSRPSARHASGASVDVLRQQDAASGAVLVALDEARDSSAAVRSLSLADRDALFGSALLAFGRRWNGTEWTPTISSPAGLSDARYARPLDVLLEAFDAALSGPRWHSGDRPPVERALDHEERHWRARVAGFDPLLLRRSAALATLAGARDEQEAADILALVPDLSGETAAAERRRVDHWLSGLYDGPDRWNPLGPDRLAEELVVRTMHDDDDGGQRLLSAALDLPSDTQVERALDVTARLADDPRVAAVIAEALIAQHGTLVDRCARQTRGATERPGQTRLLDALVRLHTATMTEDRLADLPAPVQTQLSLSFDSLGDLARDHGRGPDAWMIFAGALAIDQRRSAAEPGNTTYRRDLSVSYNKLGNLAVAAGRAGDAETLYRQSLQVAEELAAAEPGNTTYRRDLSVSYERLADLAVAAGRALADAETLYRQSLQARQELAAAEPGNTTYRRDLSVSYNKLADLAVAAGRARDAETLYRQALQARQELAAAEPGNTTYRRDLSVSYDKLADLAVAAGQAGDAETLYRQALQARQELAAAEPGNTTYRRDLSISYNKLADLAVAAGRAGDAETLYRQSLQARQELAAAEPGNTTYRRDLSISYNKLADLAVAAGRAGDAETLYRQALQVAEELAAAEPGNTTYRRDLSVSYNKLADLAVAAGRAGDAETLYRQALQVAEELAAAEPGNTTYRRDLSVSYERLADLAIAADLNSAKAFIERALALRRFVHAMDRTREDVAVELGYALYVSARIAEQDGLRTESAHQREEIGQILGPLEEAQVLGQRGRSILSWARA